VRLRTLRGVEVRWDTQGHGIYSALLPLRDAEPGHTLLIVDDRHVLPREAVSALRDALASTPRTLVVARSASGDTDAATDRAADAGPAGLPARAGVVAVPPGLLDAAAVGDLSTARRLAPNHPDLWLWACARRAGVAVRTLRLAPLPAVAQPRPARDGAAAAAAAFTAEHDALVAAFGLDDAR
jgi:hypothetical protein